MVRFRGTAPRGVLVPHHRHVHGHDVSFSFSVTDSGTTPQSITETVSINIINFNDAPVLPATAIQLDNGTEDTAYNFSAADLLNGVTDPDVNYAEDGETEISRDVDNLRVTGLTASNGTISLNFTLDPVLSSALKEVYPDLETSQADIWPTSSLPGSPSAVAVYMACSLLSVACVRSGMPAALYR